MKPAVDMWLVPAGFIFPERTLCGFFNSLEDPGGQLKDLFAVQEFVYVVQGFAEALEVDHLALP